MLLLLVLRLGASGAGESRYDGDRRARRGGVPKRRGEAEEVWKANKGFRVINAILVTITTIILLIIIVIVIGFS